MIESHPKSVAELVDAFGGSSAYARVLGIGPSTASEHKRARSIPVKYWPALVAAANSAGISGVTNDALVAMHVERSPVEARP